MRKWRVVRVTSKGTLHVVQDPTFWTRRGAQAGATHLNTTFGAIEALANALAGHNYFVSHVNKIPMLEAALKLAQEA